jgi:hypothetical protein
VGYSPDGRIDAWWGAAAARKHPAIADRDDWDGPGQGGSGSGPKGGTDYPAGATTKG